MSGRKIKQLRREFMRNPPPADTRVAVTVVYERRETKYGAVFDRKLVRHNESVGVNAKFRAARRAGVVA